MSVDNSIGFIGLGMRSSQEYCSYFQKFTRQKLGGRSSAKIVMLAPNFAEIAELQTDKNDWSKLHDLMIELAAKIKYCGASCLVIGANTMHVSVPFIEAKVVLQKCLSFS